MRAFNKAKVAAFLGVIFLALAFFGGRKPAGRTWEVVFSGLPVKITTAKASHNTLYYILKQTHEPLFRQEDGDNFTSRLLSSWKRSVDSKTYGFCLKPGLWFNERDRFDHKAFLEYISGVTKSYDPKFSVTTEDGCFSLRFDRSAKGYLEFLSLYENAPTRESSPFIEDGLGPFRAVSLDDKRIVLHRKTPVAKGFNSIIVHDFKGSGDLLLNNKNISDFNRVQSSDVPQWAMERYRGFDNIRLKSVILVINHPDKNVREVIYNCLDAGVFRKAYFPKLEGMYDIQNVFPLGVPGALPGRPPQFCHKKKLKEKVSIDLANLRDDNHKELELFVRNFFDLTGIEIKVINYVPTALTIRRAKMRWAYNLLVMSADAVRPEQNAFVAPFLRRERRFVDYPLPALQRAYEKMLAVQDPVVGTVLGKKLAKGISEEFVVLPLFQAMGRMYYPEKIKNLDAGKGFLEYPEVADFRW